MFEESEINGAKLVLVERNEYSSVKVQTLQSRLIWIKIGSSVNRVKMVVQCSGECSVCGEESYSFDP